MHGIKIRKILPNFILAFIQLGVEKMHNWQVIVRIFIDLRQNFVLKNKYMQSTNMGIL